MEQYIFKKILTTKAFFDEKIDPHLPKFLSTNSTTTTTTTTKTIPTTLPTKFLTKFSRMSSKVVDSNFQDTQNSEELTQSQLSALTCNDKFNKNVSSMSMFEGSRAEATFQLCIREFSKFKESKENRLSPEPCIIRNLPWKILAMSKQLNNKDFVLGFFLQCNADSDSNRWSVAATAELRLLHITDPEKNLVKSNNKPKIKILDDIIKIKYCFFFI